MNSIVSNQKSLDFNNIMGWNLDTYVFQQILIIYFIIEYIFNKPLNNNNNNNNNNSGRLKTHLEYASVVIRNKVY